MQITPPVLPPDRSGQMWRQAQALEVRFLAEMLRHTGLATMPGSLGGGIGEEQFGSFLREAQAEAMVRGGGIGLAESFYRSLSERARS